MDTTTERGRAAEAAVAQWYSQQGFRIIATNWRTRWCEIDIVAKHQKIVYFIEVKYRRSRRWGDGFSYVGTRKQAAMIRAVRFWCAAEQWEGDCRLVVVAVDDEFGFEARELEDCL